MLCVCVRSSHLDGHIRCGVLGSLPGTATGSQSVEAFHAYWQRLMAGARRCAAGSVLQHMQGLFSGEWRDHFGWAEACSTSLWPQVHDPAIMHGTALKAQGRSSAVEFWQHRDKGNHYYHETAGTQFWIMRACAPGGLQPAESAVGQARGRLLMRLVASEGEDLEKLLYEAQLVKGTAGGGDWRLSVSDLRVLFEGHAVVFAGELSKKFWPKYHRQSREEIAPLLCSCPHFGRRAECEHVVFAKGLLNLIDLRSLPVLRKKGRRRHGSGSLLVPGPPHGMAKTSLGQSQGSPAVVTRKRPRGTSQ